MVEQVEPLLGAVDGLLQGPALDPVIRVVMGLGQQAGRVARPPPLPQGAHGGRRGLGAREEGQEVEDLQTVDGPGSAVEVVDPGQEVQLAAVLFFTELCQRGLGEGQATGRLTADGCSEAKPQCSGYKCFKYTRCSKNQKFLLITGPFAL